MALKTEALDVSMTWVSEKSHWDMPEPELPCWSTAAAGGGLPGLVFCL